MGKQNVNREIILYHGNKRDMSIYVNVYIYLK